MKTPDLNDALKQIADHEKRIAALEAAKAAPKTRAKPKDPA